MDHRLRLILAAVKDTTGDILHLGCCDSKCSMESDTWLHKQLVDAVPPCRRVIGLDIDRARVKDMQQAGYSAVNASVYTAEIEFPGMKFSLIVFGELIEHLSSPLLALGRARNLLSDNGKIILTTPNPFAATHALWFWLSGGREHHGDEHILWESPRTMQSLCKSVGLIVEKTHFCSYGFQRRKWWAHSLALLELIPWLRQTVVYEIVKEIGAT